jgi:hypothetical protein
MTVQELPRTDLNTTHAYTLPVVREVPIRAGAPTPSPAPRSFEQPSISLAGARAW